MSGKKMLFYPAKSIELFLLLLLFSLPTQASIKKGHIWDKAFYIGAIAGFGTTSWEGLVPESNNQNLALNLSTPIAAREGGAVFGVVTGYEFTPNFAIEATYMKYNDAKVVFDESSLFSYTYEGSTEFLSSTESINVMAKVMIFFPKSDLRFFSSVGIANVHRQDMITESWSLKPTFGLGLNYPIQQHLIAEIAGNYSAGYGESLLNPAETYIPFLTSITFRIAYMF